LSVCTARSRVSVARSGQPSDLVVPLNISERNVARAALRQQIGNKETLDVCT
jgi:hypothetical protein